MITPTVGRVVWFYHSGDGPGQSPEAAIVAYVWNASMVNLAVFDRNGTGRSETSITLVHPEGARPEGPFCTWMPYQIGQAAKTEELQKKFEQECPPEKEKEVSL